MKQRGLMIRLALAVTFVVLGVVSLFATVVVWLVGRRSFWDGTTSSLLAIVAIAGGMLFVQMYCRSLKESRHQQRGSDEKE